MKKRKKTTGKRVSKSRSTSPIKSSLSGAIKDLDREIKKLKKDKDEMKRNLGQVTSTIDVDRHKEKLLQQKIARLIDKEARLSQRKKNLQTKIDHVSDKVNKISKIKSEMSDI